MSMEKHTTSQNWDRYDTTFTNQKANRISERQRSKHVAKNFTSSFIDLFFSHWRFTFVMYKIYRPLPWKDAFPSQAYTHTTHSYLWHSASISATSSYWEEREREREKRPRESRVVVRLLGALLRDRLEPRRVGRLVRVDDGLGGHLHPRAEIPHHHSHLFSLADLTCDDVSWWGMELGIRKPELLSSSELQGKKRDPRKTWAGEKLSFASFLWKALSGLEERSKGLSD